ncbi:MAG: TPM domain-containing protein, partial [Actinobacteria bacterium]|nr:TPM domain-containing protein [Actinomycetota bacterium]
MAKRLLAALTTVVLMALQSAPVGARAQEDLPRFTAPVVDAANVVPDDVERQVGAALEDYRRRSGNQVAVALVRTIGDRSLEDYSIDLAREWGVGTRGDDNGVLLLIVVEDRHVRIEVGRGVEGDLTDLESGRIIRERLIPLLRAGDFGGAVRQGTDAIRSALGDDAVGDLPPLPEGGQGEDSPGLGNVLFPLLLFGLAGLSMFGRSRRRWGGAVPIFWGGGLGGGGAGRGAKSSGRFISPSMPPS